MKWRQCLKAIVGVGLIAGALTIAGARPATAENPLRPLQAFITNSPAAPVPVSIAGVQQVTPPLWQGTPFATFDVVINRDSGGIEFCEQSFAASTGTAVLLKTVSGSFSLPPGGAGHVGVRITGVDGPATFIEVPMHRTAGSSQVDGIAEAYSGSLNFDGFPVTKVETCAIGIKTVAGVSFIGYTVTLP